MRVLFIGDIYGKPGREMLEKSLPELKEKYKPNIIIVNAENSANNGRSINQDYYIELMKMGVSAITMGNHVWDNKNLKDFIEDTHIVRPANFYEAPGKGYDLIRFNDKTLLVINLLGRTFMNANVENPFFVTEKIINEVEADYIFIDFHAEATSEKIAFAHYFDGRVNGIVGTHTHVQTADNRVMPKGTLYITDVGMTGPLEGIIGVDKDIVINRFLYGHSRANKVAESQNQLNGVIMDFEDKTIERIHLED